MTPYEIARQDEANGVQEIVGKESHPRILEAFDLCSYDPDDDSVAWCSAIMNLWQHEAGNPITESAAARSWLTWGVKVSGDPQEGDVLIFRRNNSPSSGHVCFFVRKVGDKYLCLGGNQGDAIKESWYSTADLLGIRRAA